jgi:hypothetical protein
MISYNDYSDKELAETLADALAKLQTANEALALAQEAYTATAYEDDDDYDFSNGAAGLLATMTAPAVADMATLQKARRAARAIQAQVSRIQAEQQERRIRAAYHGLWAHIIASEPAIRAVVDIIRRQDAITATAMVPPMISRQMANDLLEAVRLAHQALGR